MPLVGADGRRPHGRVDPRRAGGGLLPATVVHQTAVGAVVNTSVARYERWRPRNVVLQHVPLGSRDGRARQVLHGRINPLQHVKSMGHEATHFF